MAEGKVIQLYSDIGKSQPVYPKTNVKCVYNDNGDRLDQFLSCVANPHNLLDNSDFTNPVNQRGKNIWNAQTYTIDRWMLYNSDFSKQSARLTSDGLRCDYDGTMQQILSKDEVPNDILSNYTLVMWRPDGSKVVKTNNFGWIDDNDNYVIALDAGTWAHVALYKGHYSEETVPEYQPKGYAAELAECQRYYLAMNALGGGTSMGVGMAANATTIRILVPTPVPMRVRKPAVECPEYTDFTAYGNGGYVNVTKFEAVYTSNSGVTINCTMASAVTVHQIYAVHNRSAKYFALNADL